MARKFKLLSVICFVVACLGPATTTADVPSTSVKPTTTTADVPSTTVKPTTTTADVPSTTVKPTTTTADVPSTTVKPTTTTADVPSTTVKPTTTTADVPSTTVKPTTTTADVTSTTVKPTTTTADVPSTTVKPTTTTADVPSTTVKPTTTTADVPSTTVKPTTTTADVPSTTVKPTTTTADVPSTTVKPTTTTADVPSTTVKPTTTTAGVTSTTVKPTTTTAGVTSTTVKPTTTTAGVTSTTVKPTTTTAALTSTTSKPTTTTAGLNSTTSKPTTTATRPGASTSTASATTQLPGPCDADPCHDRSTCEARVNQTFVCLCLAGDEYNYGTKRCERAQVFPGQLDLPNLVYDPKMSVKTSQEFLEASLIIMDEMDTVFKDTESYSGSTVLELRQMSSKFRTVSDGGVSATVDIIFTADSDIKTTDVTEKLDNATKCEDCLMANATFVDKDLCHKNPCDDKTAECLPIDGTFNCTCLENYIETDFSYRQCIACPSGEKAQDSKTCVKCPFGQSGFNCNDSWKLVLVIVGSSLGGLLLITLILLPIIARNSLKKSSKKDKSATSGKPYASHTPAQKPLVNSSLANSQAALVHGSANGLSGIANAGVPRIPRATTTNSWDSRSNLEMTPSNSRQNLVPVGRNPRFYDDREDMNPYAQARPQSNLYEQTRPQNNPYAQNRPQSNPYAQGQGQSNPYYMHDDGRRFN